MTCDVADVMEKDRQYALGWVRLFGEQTSVAAEMGQYALDLLKLKHAHMQRCWICRQAQEKQPSPSTAEWRN